MGQSTGNILQTLELGEDLADHCGFFRWQKVTKKSQKNVNDATVLLLQLGDSFQDSILEAISRLCCTRIRRFSSGGVEVGARRFLWLVHWLSFLLLLFLPLLLSRRLGC